MDLTRAELDELDELIRSALDDVEAQASRRSGFRGALDAAGEPFEAVRAATGLVTAVLEPVLELFYAIERLFGFAVDGTGNREIIGRMSARFRSRAPVISDELAGSLRLMRRYYRFEPRSYRGEASVREVAAILDGLPQTVARLREELRAFTARLAAEPAEPSAEPSAGLPAGILERQHRLWDEPPDPKRTDTDIAEALLGASGHGRILAVAAPSGGRIKVPSREGFAEVERHEAYTHSGLVFDPCCARDPVPLGDYLRQIRELNGFQPVCRYRGLAEGR